MDKRDLIFVIEDDPFYGSVLINQLALMGYTRLELYTSGSDCIKNIYKQPKLILLDYNIGDLNGKSVLKEILSFKVNTPVIFLSGQTSIQESIDTLKLGAYDYIQKNDKTFMKLEKAIARINAAFAQVNTFGQRLSRVLRQALILILTSLDSLTFIIS